jgi:hypothetical protein
MGTGATTVSAAEPERTSSSLPAIQFVFTGNHGKDVITDMTREDSIYLDASYFDGMKNGAEVLDAYARVAGRITYIEFGEDSIQINNWTDLKALAGLLHSAEDLL